jgi:hypothetical protein
VPNNEILTSLEPFWTDPDSFLQYNFGSIPPGPVREPTRGTTMAPEGCWGRENDQKRPYKRENGLKSVKFIFYWPF